MNDEQTKLLSEMLAQMKADSQAYADFRATVLKGSEDGEKVRGQQSKLIDKQDRWIEKQDRRADKRDYWVQLSAMATIIYRLIVLFLLYSIYSGLALRHI